MSTFGEFADKMLIALYQETERTGQDYHAFGDLIDRYGLEWKEQWINRLADEWDHGIARDVNRFHAPTRRDWSVKISAQGMRQVETQFGAKDGVGTMLEPVTPASALDDTFVFDGGPQPPVDSSKWTGLPPSFVLSERKRKELVSSLEAAERQLDSLPLGNSEKGQVRAYILAAAALAEAPDPPPDLIWELINRANSIAGIASLFVSILALFA